MIVTIGILLAGFLFGLLLKGRVKLPTSAITMASICLLLFILGLEIGGNDELLGNLPTMGLTALIVTVLAVLQVLDNVVGLLGHLLVILLAVIVLLVNILGKFKRTPKVFLNHQVNGLLAAAHTAGCIQTRSYLEYYVVYGKGLVRQFAYLDDGFQSLLSCSRP